MTNPAHTDRYKRAVRRTTIEAFWLFTDETALIALSNIKSVGLEFFRVAHTALLGDRLLRLIRVFDENQETAAFWYLYRCNPKFIDQCIKPSTVTLPELRDLSQRLKRVRDKTFIHIDKDGVFDPEMIYRKAGINLDKVDRAIRGLWATMQAVFQVTLGETFAHDSYSGSDIAALEKYRDDFVSSP
jgi:hypothetical protein